MDYLDKKELTEEIIILQTTGVITDSLTYMIDMMICGIANKYGKTQDPDDIKQDCWMFFLQIYMKIDLNKNSFSYLTTCFINLIRLRHKQSDNYLSLDTQFEDTAYDPSEGDKVTYHPKNSNNINKKTAYKRNNRYYVDGEPMPKFCKGDSKKARKIQARLRRGWNQVEAVYGRVRKHKYKITYKGKSLSISEWAKKTGLTKNLILQRLHKGWPPDQILFKEPQKKYTFNGESLTINEWSNKTGLSIKLIRSRLESGWSIERALTTPKKETK